VRIETWADTAADVVRHNVSDEWEIRLKEPEEKEDDALLIQSRPAAEVPVKTNPIPAFAIKKSADSSVAAKTIARKAPEVVPVASARKPVQRKATPRGEPDLIVALNIVAREQHPFRGDAILKTLETLGLELAEQDVFHLREENSDGELETVFFVASMMKPGTFERATIEQTTTPGLTAFMPIPGPVTASEAFDTMVEKAGSIAVRLNGTVCDEQRVPLSPQRTREIRERMLNYDFSNVAKIGEHVVRRDS
jgi:cell division protein ZipA